MIKRHYVHSVTGFAFLFALSFSASGAVIATGTITIDGTESISSGTRLFRDAMPSTWAAPKAFPGTSSCGGTCFFELLNFAAIDPLVQVTYQWAGGANTVIFGSAYLNSFSTANLATNYLGDGGSSVAPPNPGPQIFQVTVPSGNSLVLVFNSLPAGGLTGLGNITYTVEAFSAAATPEPGTFAFLLGGGVFGLMFLRSQRSRRQ